MEGSVALSKLALGIALGIGQLSRYESAMQRNLMRTLHELQRLQAARRGEHVPAPVAVDIDVTGLPEQGTPSDESGPSTLT